MCKWFLNATYANGRLRKWFPLAEVMAQRYQRWLLKCRAKEADPSTDLVIVRQDSELCFPDLLAKGYLRFLEVELLYPQTGGFAIVQVYVRPGFAAKARQVWEANFSENP
jgi:hypothetical protein